MLGLLSYALKRVIIELCQEKSSNHEKHGWNFYSKAVLLQPLFSFFLYCDKTEGVVLPIDNLFCFSYFYPLDMFLWDLYN